jgi:GT2 family glycosyltransferase
MPPKSNDPGKRISAVICTYNRYDVLAEALVSLDQQTLPAAEYEVIVIDNSSDAKGQRSFWRRSRGRYSASVHIQAEPGLSKARNTGLRAACAPLVAYCDDDAVVSPGWLQSLVTVFEDQPRAGVAGGPVVPIWPGQAPRWLHPWLSGFFTIIDRGPLRRELAADEWLAGTNIAFRRDLLVELGGFDENLGRRGARLLSNEDLDMTRRIGDLGFTSWYEPAAVVHHKVHEARVDQAWLRRRVAWQAISDALVHDAPGQSDGAPWWETIADYALRAPPEMRGLRGLFLDTDDPEVLNRQCQAIGALARLMMFDARDPERTAAE